jgi:predicted ester cyclase
MRAERNELLIRRLIEEAANPGNLEVLNEVAEGEFAQTARRWVGPSRASFPDFTMEIVDLVADSEKVAAHIPCSGDPPGRMDGSSADRPALPRCR